MMVVSAPSQYQLASKEHPDGIELAQDCTEDCAQKGQFGAI
jgi:hypothetical protein